MAQTVHIKPAIIDIDPFPPIANIDIPPPVTNPPVHKQNNNGFDITHSPFRLNSSIPLIVF
jgi:hypothetical protein